MAKCTTCGLIHLNKIELFSLSTEKKGINLVKKNYFLHQSNILPFAINVPLKQTSEYFASLC